MFLTCFLIFTRFQPHVSYKNVSYKKKCVSSENPLDCNMGTLRQEEKCLHVSMALYLFLFNINCKHIDKQNSCSSLMQIFQVNNLQNENQLFTLEFIEVKLADQKLVCVYPGGYYAHRTYVVKLNSWNFVLCSPSSI